MKRISINANPYRVFVSMSLITACLATTLSASAKSGDNSPPAASSWKTATVTASSYTLSASETAKSSVGISAFGDRLKPGDKAIAVSRDLLKNGLSYGSQVQIEGLDGIYVVLDKMHRRWRNKIDILFAKRKRALNWGVQKVKIRYRNVESD